MTNFSKDLNAMS